MRYNELLNADVAGFYSRIQGGGGGVFRAMALPKGIE